MAASLVIAAIVAGTPVSAFPVAGPAAPAPPAGRTGLLLFVSSPGSFVLPISATEARRSASRVVEAAWIESGHDVLGVDTFERILRKRRVRSERDLRSGFLGAIHEDRGVTVLVIVRMVLHVDRTVFLARALDPVDGNLIWVDAVEFPNDRERWKDEAEARRQLHELATEAGTELASHWADGRPSHPAGTMVLMPLAPVGLGGAATEIVTHCLLHALVESARWDVPDPALVVGALREGRHDLGQFDSGSRRELAERFTTDALLVPRLVSFADRRDRPAALVDEENEADVLLDEMVDTPLYLTLSLVDCSSGGLVAGVGGYLKPADRVGIFGRVNDVRLVERIQTGADRVVRDLFPTPRGP
jgi:hypothetical protein